MFLSSAILIGNTFPFSLVRREIRARIVSLDEVRASLAGARIVSFWGHENTRPLAESLLGVNLRPATDRPALCLSPEGFPTLDGETFRSCLVCSPDYRQGFRPAIGEEVPPDAIVGWQLLRIEWP